MVQAIAESNDLEINQYVRVVATELSRLGLQESEPYDFLIDFTVSSPAFVGERLQPYSSPYTQMSCFRDLNSAGVCVPRYNFSYRLFSGEIYFISLTSLNSISLMQKPSIGFGKAGLKLIVMTRRIYLHYYLFNPCCFNQFSWTIRHYSNDKV
jgi:hypothetical protein